MYELLIHPFPNSKPKECNTYTEADWLYNSIPYRCKDVNDYWRKNQESIRNK